jgi:hypothetical protein
MAKAASITYFKSDRGTEYLYLNGGAVRQAFNKAREQGYPLRPFDLSNFAKVAFMRRAGGAASLAIKPTAAHAYEAVHTACPNTPQRLAEALTVGVSWQGSTGILDTLREAVAMSVATGAITSEVWERLRTFAVQADPVPEQAPQPQPKPEHAPERKPDATPAVQRGPSALASFGALGDAIRTDIDAAVAVAIEKAPKPTVQAITISIPEGKPITLPEGEVLHERFDRLLTSVTRQKPKDCNALLLGPRGSGKTHAAEQVAKALGRPFDAVSMSGGTTERAFWGSTIIRNGTMEWRPSRFVEMFRTGGVFLIDELDKADATVVTALNMATSNGYICPIDGPGRIDRHPEFVCIACANALWADRAYTGSSRPDASSLERFDVINWDYSKAITARVAAECGDATQADWLIRLSDALRARIASKGWRGEQEWSTRSVARVASWIRCGKTRAEAIEWELESRPANVREELAMCARGIV